MDARKTIFLPVLLAAILLTLLLTLSGCSDGCDSCDEECDCVCQDTEDSSTCFYECEEGCGCGGCSDDSSDGEACNPTSG